MKYKLIIKSPDSIGDFIDEVAEYERPETIDNEEWDYIKDIRREKLAKKLEKWIGWQGYVTIQFDLDAGTAKVLEN